MSTETNRVGESPGKAGVAAPGEGSCFGSRKFGVPARMFDVPGLLVRGGRVNVEPELGIGAGGGFI